MSPDARLILHITQECDSNIEFLVNGKNLLDGYLGAMVYPTYMFLKSMNNGLAEAINSGFAPIPIYLQQYSFLADSPHHIVKVAIDRGDMTRATLTFVWCESIRRPDDVPTVFDESVLVADFIRELRHSLAQFKDAVAGSQLPHSSVGDLFNDFSDLGVC